MGTEEIAKEQLKPCAERLALSLLYGGNRRNCERAIETPGVRGPRRRRSVGTEEIAKEQLKPRIDDLARGIAIVGTEEIAKEQLKPARETWHPDAGRVGTEEIAKEQLKQAEGIKKDECTGGGNRRNCERAIETKPIVMLRHPMRNVGTEEIAKEQLKPRSFIGIKLFLVVGTEEIAKEQLKHGALPLQLHPQTRVGTEEIAKEQLKPVEASNKAFFKSYCGNRRNCERAIETAQ